jgi:hypothetical protein
MKFIVKKTGYDVYDVRLDYDTKAKLQAAAYWTGAVVVGLGVGAVINKKLADKE